MRKQIFGRKLKRDANERKALLKGLMNDLVLKESIQTTEEKAKAIKGAVEKLITKAKVKGQKAERLLQPYLTPMAIKKVLKDFAGRFEKRSGGYTRIIKLGQRFGDNAKMCIVEWVEKQNQELKIKNQEVASRKEKVKKIPASSGVEKKKQIKKKTK